MDARTPIELLTWRANLIFPILVRDIEDTSKS